MKLVLQLDKKFLLRFGLAVVVLAVFLFGIFVGLTGKIPFSLPGKQTVLRYGEKVELAGTLTQKQFYGAPGFGLNPSEDEKENCYVFVLDKSNKVLAGKDEFEKAYEAVDELQLVNIKGIVLEPYLEQKVEMEGEFMGAQTGHHHTDVLLVLDKITSGSKSALKKENKIQEEKPAEPTLKSHTFRTSNGKEFTFNYSSNLDLIEATGYMVGERVRLKPKGEDIKESYLIAVDEPPTELGEGIYISWEEIPVKFGNNSYKRGSAVYLPENSRVVMAIFSPLPPLNLYNITVAPWDSKRLTEALQETTTILKTLKEVK